MEYTENYKVANINKYKNSKQKEKVLKKTSTLDIYKKTCKVLFAKDDKVLDIAGGPGVHTDILREKKITEKIYAIDISATLLKERNKDDICVEGDMENLPYENNYFDKALFNAALHHTDKTNRTLGEAKRVLKKGGSIILIEPISVRLLFTGKEIEPTPDGVEFILSIKYILKHLKKLNLSIEYIRYYGYLTRYISLIWKNNKLNFYLTKLEFIINYIPGVRNLLGMLGNKVYISAKKVD